MHTFTKRGFGRIYLINKDDADKVKAIIKEIDEFESKYMPEDLIAPFSEYPKVVYMHKFSDMDLNHLTALCFARDIPVFCFDAGTQEHPPSALLRSD